MISLSEIRNRSHIFTKKWKSTTYELDERQIYNPLKLLKTHKAIDKLFKSDTERVTQLFELNQKLTSLVVDEPKKRGRK